VKSFLPILKATKYVGGSTLILGIALFIYGFFVSDYGNVTGIGIGTIMGAVFIFVMGIFLVASEEMVTKIRGRKTE
jgi:magnesium-transporting ATPase (P-type)